MPVIYQGSKELSYQIMLENGGVNFGDVVTIGTEKKVGTKMMMVPTKGKLESMHETLLNIRMEDGSLISVTKDKVKKVEEKK